MSSLHRSTFHSGKPYRQSFHGLMCVIFLGVTISFIHRLPSLVDDFRNQNRTLDVIILNNGISDSRFSDPWLEAVVRYLLEHFPQILIISIIDGIPGFVRCRHCRQRYGRRHGIQGDTLQRFLKTQNYYHVTGIDFAAMSRLLIDSDEEIYKILRDRHPHSSSLWPQEERTIHDVYKWNFDEI